MNAKELDDFVALAAWALEFLHDAVGVGRGVTLVVTQEESQSAIMVMGAQMSTELGESLARLNSNPDAQFATGSTDGIHVPPKVMQ